MESARYFALSRDIGSSGGERLNGYEDTIGIELVTRLKDRTKQTAHRSLPTTNPAQPHPPRHTWTSRHFLAQAYKPFESTPRVTMLKNESQTTHILRLYELLLQTPIRS